MVFLRGVGICILWLIAPSAALAAGAWLLAGNLLGAIIAGAVAWAAMRGIVALGDGLPA